MPSLQSRSCDVDLLKLKLFYYSPSDPKGTGVREPNPIHVKNSNLIEPEVITSARRSHSGSTTAAGLRLFFGRFFDRQPNYWALSAIFSVNNEVVEDRFIKWEQDFKPFIHNEYHLERAALEFKFEERSQPGDTLSVAVFVYSKDYQGRQRMVSRLFTVMSIRMLAERGIGPFMERLEKDPKFLRERLHPFLPGNNSFPQPRNPLIPSSGSEDTHYKEVPDELAAYEASNRLGDDEDLLQLPSRLSLIHRIGADPRSLNAPHISSSRNIRLDLQREEREVESLRLQVKEKRERIERLKERFERNENLDLDSRSSTASQPHSRFSRATENESFSPTQDQSDPTSYEREFLGPSSILEEKRESNLSIDSLSQNRIERFKSNSPAPLVESLQANGTVLAFVDQLVGEERAATGAIESENEDDYDSDSDRSLA